MFEVSVDGYKQLEIILQRAYEQASGGKGKERHANNLPFEEQPMQAITILVGVGFPLGQAIKKLQEAAGMLERDQDDAAVREMLGAIVYTAGAILHVELNK